MSGMRRSYTVILKSEMGLGGSCHCEPLLLPQPLEVFVCDAGVL